MYSVGSFGLTLPVDIDIEPAAEVVSNGIDHNVEDDGCKDPVSVD
jgi:hypothetical protein